MENKNLSPKGDEKTKVISVSPSLANQQALAKAASPIASAKPQLPETYSAYFKNGKTSAHRTIIAGAIGAGLLVSLVALTSFKKKSNEDDPGSSIMDNPVIAADTVIPEDTIIPEDTVIGINTGHEVYTTVHDNLPLEEARTIAREHIGTDGLFMHQGQLHLARTDEEWNGLTQDHKLQYINDINVTLPSKEDVVTLPVDVGGNITDLKMDPLHLGDQWQLGFDDSGHTFFIPQGRSAIALDNISRGEDGIYYRTDPVTFEMKVFSVEEVIQQIDQHGSVNLEVLIPGNDEPVIDDPIWNWATEDGFTPGPNLDLIPPSDYQLAYEAALQIAREAGIDDIGKVKVHQDRHGNYDYKVKGDHGEKIKGSFTPEDLHAMHEDAAVTGHIITDNNQDDTDAPIENGLIVPGDESVISNDDSNIISSHPDLLGKPDIDASEVGMIDPDLPGKHFLDATMIEPDDTFTAASPDHQIYINNQDEL